MAAGLVAALVVPTDADAAAVGRADDLAGLEALVAPAPVITTPRVRSLRAGLNPALPYVVASRPVPPGLVDRVRLAAPLSDAVLAFSYKSYAIARALGAGLGLPVVVREHNLEGQYHHALAAAASGPRSWAMRLEAVRVDRDERRLERASWLSGVADISLADAEVRRRRARVPVAYVPTFALGPRTADTAAAWTPNDSKTVVFLGALDVATNHDAVSWFAARVWPQVLAAVPEARWQVVGRKPSAAVRRLVAETPQTELHADVPSPAAFLSAAAVAVNPAVSGSGVNIKLVDYLAVGVPVVSTTRGMLGLGLDATMDLAVEDESAAFAQRLATLLRDQDQAARLGAAGHAKALAILDTSGSLATLASLFGSAHS
jgi:glycosyltransferase involved in cell wall biosynthesis